MPNWCEGSLKLKGDFKNIRKFLAERVLYTDVKDVPEETVKSSVTPDDIHINIISWRWIKDTNRAFLTPQEVFYYNEGAINLNMSQAWGFDPDEWIAISNTYDLQIKLYGVEQGMMFTNYIFIKDGEIEEEKSEVYEKYEDWIWNVPFPHMGG